jgi:type I restriction enzyme M protein
MTPSIPSTLHWVPIMQLERHLAAYFCKSQLTARQVGGLINLLSNPKLSQGKSRKRCFRTRLRVLYREVCLSRRQWRRTVLTGSIVRLMVEMIEPYQGKIFDAACGSGGMFVQSLKFIQSHGGDKKHCHLWAGTLRRHLTTL